MTVRQWQVIDAIFDNEVQNRIDDFASDEEVQAAMDIREAGWAWNRTIDDGRKGELGWPPDGDVVDMELRTGQWSLVLSVLEHERRSSDERGVPEDAALARELLGVLSAQLPGVD
ncbi:hypothetical protein FNH05_33875 [Amycolatopsis rhizosphaerae]|uniref:Uncharacterized protein n=1 Tax=Amycolatopsis rhizosphaerae TaxID=2053003 RepID=A0A558ABN8_9PSEU|nr:hypothetical protein [Amycolatopsis rhizosphaerae]TVT21645.1 hypothetical protein FNH05_33875 [Amycolatopsis rhizosphaerae]